MHAEAEKFLPLKADPCVQVVFLTGALVGGEILSCFSSSCHL